MSFGHFLTLGCPLIDVIVKVGKCFLDEFDLKENDAVSATKQTLEIFNIINIYSPVYQVGGCSLNTARTLQRILKRPNSCTVVGCIGDDEYSNVIKNQLKRDLVNYTFEKIPKCSTGRCAVLLNGSNRSLCTDLGASKQFRIEHLYKVWNAVENSSYYYIPGFFLNVSKESVWAIAKHSSNYDKTFAFNLSAPFIVDLFKEDLYELLSYINILFGNEAEVRAFAQALQFTSTNLIDILLYINGLNTRSKPMLTIITRGSASVCAVFCNHVSEYPVGELDAGKVKDTSSAGDCFVGGFMAAYMMKRPIGDCVNCGINTAKNVVQNNGCWFNSD